MTKFKVQVYRREDIPSKPWAINYRLPSGKRVRKIVSHRKDLAQIVAQQVEMELNRGNYDPQFMTVDDFYDEFLASVSTRSEKTVRLYRLTGRRFCDLFGDCFLTQITAAHVEEFLAALRHLAPATQTRYFRELSVAMNSAVKRGYLPRSPCAAVRAPRVPKNPPRLLEGEDVLKLLKSVEGTPYHGLLTTAAYTGLRREELVWLEWEDVDLKRRQIYVRNKPDHPLKDHEARTVPITKLLIDVLKGLPRNGQWVFTSPEGKRWNSANLSRRVAPLFRKVGIAGAFHTLRHAYASHLVMAGVDLPTVQKLLGHSSITTTMIYAHVAQDHVRTQVEKLRY